ncbi:MAG: hypothetical protein EXR74_04340 [Bdellovibrionales bacterium]|nr:hypothetical protein [Bdellovibrionales bacterium]
MKNVIIALVVAIFGATSMIYANETAPVVAPETTAATAAPVAEAHPAGMEEHKGHKGHKGHKKAKKAKKAAAEEAPKVEEAAPVAK